MGFAAARRDLFAVDDCRLPGDALPRSVGVPVQRAAIRMVSVRISIRVEIRETIKLGKTVGVILAHHVNLHWAETTRECDLPRGRNLLRTEQQHLMAQKRLIDRIEDLVAHGGGV